MKRISVTLSDRVYELVREEAYIGRMPVATWIANWVESHFAAKLKTGEGIDAEGEAWKTEQNERSSGLGS